jgi:hypothetical protein
MSGVQTMVKLFVQQYISFGNASCRSLIFCIPTIFIARKKIQRHGFPTLVDVLCWRGPIICSDKENSLLKKGSRANTYSKTGNFKKSEMLIKHFSTVCGSLGFHPNINKVHLVFKYHGEGHPVALSV